MSVVVEQIQFIPAKAEYYSAIANLVGSAAELYSVSPKAQFPWDEIQLKQVAEQRSDGTVALVDGAVAAYANLYQLVPGDSAFIGNVIVGDAYKGRGIGKALIKHMIELCQQKYQAAAQLSVFAFNTRALLMYNQLGFQPYALEPRQDLSGETVALLHMRLAKPVALQH